MDDQLGEVQDGDGTANHAQEHLMPPSYVNLGFVGIVVSFTGGKKIPLSNPLSDNHILCFHFREEVNNME